jgi:nucleoside-diphosphate-sugar epimerase
MRVLLTGASSFTGAWFVNALIERDCEVVAALRGPDHPGGRSPRARRLDLLRDRCLLVPEAPFGSPEFLELVRREAPFDLLCHHGAEVGDHRRGDFDIDAAVAADTRGVEAVLDALEAAGCRALLHTGTVFEADEGDGERPLRAFSPYGLAKTLTWHRIRFAAERRGLALGKLVVASPFGPLEKEGLTAALMRAWLNGITPRLRRPRLVRDQVPVALLADAYARLAERLPGSRGTLRVAPSGFAEPLGVFARRLAEAMRPRLRRPCEIVCSDPPEAADEPMVRKGLEPLPELRDPAAVAALWDSYAAYWRAETLSV